MAGTCSVVVLVAVMVHAKITQSAAFNTPSPTHSPTTASPTPTASAESSPTAIAATPGLSKVERTRLSRTLARYLKTRSGRLSVAVRDLDHGTTFSYNTGLRTATASIVKVEILIGLQLKAQRAGRRLTAAEQALATKMIKNSDNAATTTLFNEIGGVAGLEAVGKRLRLKHTSASYAWGATTTSAADQIRLLTALTSGKSPLNAASRRYALGLMADVRSEQAWGVSAAAADGETVALKNGWLPRASAGGAWTVNSIGRVTGDGRDFLISVISEGHPSLATGIATVEHVAHAVADGVVPASSR